MNGKIRVLGLAACALALSAQAAEVEIHWQEPERFTDIRASNTASQRQFQRQVIDELGEAIQCSADKYLPEDHRLEMTVTDLDLAGDVEYFFTRFQFGIRVVRELYFPSIEFSYALYDGEGELLKSGEENVRDMGFQFAGTYQVRNAPFGYECEMIDDWFERTFRDL